MSQAGWIGVDFDGTLCRYSGWEGPDSVGEPVPAMVERVKRWLDNGYEVRIVTARVSHPEQALIARHAIEEWCLKHIGTELEVTCCKDFDMIELWDDRSIHVVPNTGLALGMSLVEGNLQEADLLQSTALK